MNSDVSQRLVVAISSSALFDLTEADAVFKAQGLEAYQRFQIAEEDKPLPPGDAFNLVRKMLGLNELLGKERVEVILLSRNSADTGLRVFNSIEHYQLPIIRAAFCGGDSPWRYVASFGAQLFLSTNPEDVRQALKNGFAAASILPSPRASQSEQLKIAFDGDAVLFSDDSERIYQERGLDAFVEAEKAAAKEPMPGGPFKPFLQMLQQLQADFNAIEQPCPIRTALVTARSAPAHERVVRTLRHWDVRLDESLFLGGMEKGPFLQAFGADVFFDDQEGHCVSASKHVASAHVLSGVANQATSKD